WGTIGVFYLGIGLLIPLLALRRSRLDPWLRWALVTCGVEMAGILLITGVLPHYAAPITSLLAFLAVAGLRRLRLGRWRGYRLGRRYVQALALGYPVLLVLSVLLDPRAGPDDSPTLRAGILARLRQAEGKHLVLVRYEPKPMGLGHEEWVYNEADIDAAKV